MACIALKPITMDVPNCKFPRDKLSQGHFAFLKAAKRLQTEVFADSNQCSVTFIVTPFFTRNHWILAHYECGDIHKSWALRDESDALAHGFFDQRANTIPISVRIHAPNPKDPGQLCQMHAKLVRLANYLASLPSIHQLTITLTNSIPNSWHHRGTVHQSVDFAPSFRADYEVALVPFCRLQNVSHIDIHTASSAMDRLVDLDLLRSSQRVTTHTTSTGKRFHRLVCHTTQPRLQRINQRIMRQTYLLDLHLDILPGRTADMTRLDRFSRWFAPGTCGRSDYEDEILSALFGIPETVWDSDPLLTRLRYRHRAMLGLFARCSLPDFTIPPYEHHDRDPFQRRYRRRNNNNNNNNNNNIPLPPGWSHRNDDMLLILLRQNIDRLRTPRPASKPQPVWDADAWFAVFKRGIPSLYSDEFDDEYLPWVRQAFDKQGDDSYLWGISGVIDNMAEQMGEMYQSEEEEEEEEKK